LKALKSIKDWSGERLRRLLDDPLFGEYEDTLRRLLGGDFTDLGPEARREKVEQVVRASATAAMATASAPVPFLELPVQWAMVRAIAKIHGVERPGRALLWELAGSLGGGLFFRQVMRLIPLGGSLPHLSRIYGATWALGRVAEVYFERSAGGKAPRGRGDERSKMQHLFRQTAEDRAREQSMRFGKGNLPARLAELDDLRDRGVLTYEEHRRKRAQFISQWPSVE